MCATGEGASFLSQQKGPKPLVISEVMALGCWVCPSLVLNKT